MNIARSINSIKPESDWDAPQWASVPTFELGYVRPESSSHHPRVTARIACDPRGVAVLFRVDDRFVRSRHTQFQDMVCEDSCVEWFVEPRPDRGYLNFEMNCGGTLHASYIEDPTRTADGFKKFRRLTAADAAEITVRTSMPRIVEPEVATPVTWSAFLHVPFTVLERYVGPINSAPGTIWRGNFFKCGDATSHPHWLTWSPVAELNFHRPQDFAALVFG